MVTKTLLHNLKMTLDDWKMALHEVLELLDLARDLARQAAMRATGDRVSFLPVRIRKPARLRRDGGWWEGVRQVAQSTPMQYHR